MATLTPIPTIPSAATGDTLRPALSRQDLFDGIPRRDLDLLDACIEPSLGSREFFLRKGIGWALRQYAWTDPAAVVRYVRARCDRLSPLSKREALKNVLRAGLIDRIP